MTSVFTTSWSSPSNIALVKYWGKHGNQLPRNPSVSFTLENSRTHTELTLLPKESHKRELDFYFEDKKNPAFARRIETYLGKIEHILPRTLENHDLCIKSRNTFPHSTGIASSASAMSALALCLADAERHLRAQTDIDIQLVSELSRLGSGSASRSVFPYASQWGYHENTPSSSDIFAIDLSDRIDEVFKDYRDYILIMDENEKSVSSTAGHALMNNHPYAEQRYEIARKNTQNILMALESGDLPSFIEITEFEALNLHGLMMLSKPSYTLMMPSTLEAIIRIRKHRAETGSPLCFTLDAGPNIHLLFPKEYENEVSVFIQDQLIDLCSNQQIIEDHVGTGPRKEL